MTDHNSGTKTTVSNYNSSRGFGTPVKQNKDKLNSMITQADYMQKTNMFSMGSMNNSIKEPFLLDQRPQDKGK